MGAVILHNIADRLSLAKLIRAGSSDELLATSTEENDNAKEAVNNLLVSNLDDAGAAVSMLLYACSKHSVDAIIPLNDADSELLAENAEQFERLGTTIMGAKGSLPNVFRDKAMTSLWLKFHGLPTIPEVIYEGGDLPFSYPFVSKPRDGVGRKGVVFHREPGVVPPIGYLLQPLSSGPEFNLDILNDRDGKPVAVVPKRKLMIRAGATSKAVSSTEPKLIELGVALGEATRHIGSIDVDVIFWEDKPCIIDINPRLGGGFPHSCLACPELSPALNRIARGLPQQSIIGNLRDGVVSRRIFEYRQD